MKIQSFSETDLKSILDDIRSLSVHQRNDVLKILMNAECTKTPRQIAEVKALRLELERVRRVAKQAINMADELSSSLDGIFSIQTSNLKDDDES